MGEKARTLVSAESTTMVVVVQLSRMNFCIRALWPDAGVLEPRGESLMIKESLEGLAETTLCLDEEWVGEGLDEKAFPEAWLLFIDV